MIIGFIIRYLGVIMIAAAFILLGAVALAVLFIDERMTPIKKPPVKEDDPEE